MNDEPPVFKGIPTRGCFYVPGGCTVIKQLSDGEFILYEREPNNPHDSNAIRVMTVDNQKFGYVGREYAAEIAPWMDQGWFFTVWLTRIITSTPTRPCSPVLTFEPIRPAKMFQTTESEITNVIPSTPVFS